MNAHTKLMDAENVLRFLKTLQRLQKDVVLFEDRAERIRAVLEKHITNKEERAYNNTFLCFIGLLSIQIRQVKIQPIQ